MLNSLRLAADPGRLRILLLLEHEELSVAELQDILNKGQSQISTHLAQLKQAGLVDDRRTGKNAFYRSKAPADLMDLLRRAAREIPEADQDREALRLTLRKRRDTMRRYFDELAGKFGRQYVPGRSWQAVAEALLKLLPPLVIADLGAGEGTISQMMAQRARKVIAVDNSEKMVEFGSQLASPSAPARSIWPISARRFITPFTPTAPFRKPGASSNPEAASSFWISTATSSRKPANSMLISGSASANWTSRNS